MFPYFGRKATLAHLYPDPDYSFVIEPFAGSMAYSLHYRPDNAIGMEKDIRVVDLWNKMCHLREVPEPPELGSKTDDLLVKLCSYSEHALTSGTGFASEIALPAGFWCINAPFDAGANSCFGGSL